MTSSEAKLCAAMRDGLLAQMHARTLRVFCVLLQCSEQPQAGGWTVSAVAAASALSKRSAQRGLDQLTDLKLTRRTRVNRRLSLYALA